jgi:hypothetical protein
MELSQRLTSLRPLLPKMAVDGVLFAAAYVLAFRLRLDRMESPYLQTIALTVGPVVLLKIAVYHFMGSYRSIWRYSGLTDLEEMAMLTDPTDADTDGDGWRDREEIDSGTDGADPKSVPNVTVLAQPLLQIFKPSPETAGVAGAPITVGNPPVTISVPSPDAAGIAGKPITVGRPPVTIQIPKQ